MTARDYAGLDGYHLLPRVLHDTETVDTSVELLGQLLSAPIVPARGALGQGQPSTLSLFEASQLPESLDESQASKVLPLLMPDKMGVLIPQVRKLATQGVPAIAFDLTALADTPPFGQGPWRPRTREDLAELSAAGGCPLWLYGVCSPADAEIAMEAGLDGIVVHAGAAIHLGGPAAIDVFPDIFDAVAGMIGVYAGGPVRGGIDVFRYLAVGAEVVVVESDRSLANIKAELEYAMRLTGCATLADISYEAIFAPLFGETPA